MPKLVLLIMNLDSASSINAHMCYLYPSILKYFRGEGEGRRKRILARNKTFLLEEWHDCSDSLVDTTVYMVNRICMTPAHTVL